MNDEFIIRSFPLKEEEELRFVQYLPLPVPMGAFIIHHSSFIIHSYFNACHLSLVTVFNRTGALMTQRKASRNCSLSGCVPMVTRTEVGKP